MTMFVSFIVSLTLCILSNLWNEQTLTGGKKVFILQTKCGFHHIFWKIVGIFACVYSTKITKTNKNKQKNNNNNNKCFFSAPALWITCQTLTEDRFGEATGSRGTHRRTGRRSGQFTSSVSANDWLTFLFCFYRGNENQRWRHWLQRSIFTLTSA